MSQREERDHRTCDRRSFLKCGACGLLGLSTLVAGSPGCASIPHVTGRVVEPGTLTVELDSFDVDASEGEPPDSVLVHHPRLKHPILVHRDRAVSPPEFTAVSTTCTHRGCRAEPVGDRILCPCHGSEFALDGTLLDGPADEPLPSLPVETENRRLFIYLNARRDNR